jgi:hypothetical protein
MGFWYLSKVNFKHEKKKFYESIQISKNLETTLDIAELSSKFEDLIQSPYLSDSLVEDLIWIGSQYRIKQDLQIKAIVLAFTMRSQLITRVDSHELISESDTERKIRQFNSLIRITVSAIQEIYPQEFPSFHSCLTSSERNLVEDKLDEMELSSQLNDSILEIDSSKQVSMLNKFRQAPIFEKIYAQIMLLQDAAISDAHNADVAKASLQYLILDEDIINDSIGILGLVDDLYALDIGIKNSRPESFFSSLVNRHDELYPNFSLPSIKSSQSLSLINLENIIKASYTKLSDEKMKRLLILPDIGPLHVLIAMGRAICNRIDASNTDLMEPLDFKSGDHILLGTIPAVAYGREIQKPVIVQYDGPSEYKNLFWVLTANRGEKTTINKSILDEAKLITDQPPLSKLRIIDKFKNLSDKRIASWGAVDFSMNVKNAPSKRKIFIFSTQKKLNEYLHEMVFDARIGDWFGVRYFNAKGTFTDKISEKQLFPEPMFYTTSSKEQALEMIAQRWVNQTGSVEPMLIIVNEASWISDIYFLKKLKKVNADVLILSKYFDSKKNSVVQEEGFKPLSARPESLIPIKETIAGARTRLESYLHRSQPVMLEISNIQNSIVDEVLEIIQKTKFDDEHIYKKYKLTGFLRSINQRIISLELEDGEFTKLSKRFAEIMEDFTLLSRFNNDYSPLFNYLNSHQTEFLSINRLDDLNEVLETIDPKSKTLILSPYNQIEQLSNNIDRKFPDYNIGIINHNNLDYESNTDNLIIPIFIDKYQFQRLRNYRYASKHIFLMTNRESKLNAKVERYEKQLFSSIYANKPSVDVGNKITIEDIDELIEQLNPFNEILQASLKIVNTKFKSIYEAQNISSKILMLEDERILILPDGGSALTADLSESRYSISMTKVSSLSIGKSIVISESISGHDLLEAVMKSDDSNLDIFNKLEQDSQEWQIILKDYLERNALNILELRNKLSSIGIDRDVATIVSWVNSPDTVAPQNRREVIPKIFQLAEEKNSDDSKNCLQAVESMYKLRAQAREKLKEILNSLEVRQNETSFDVVIENLHIKFSIYKIQSIAASDIEFKHLYKLHDLESLNLENIYG